jgi:putative effector of murein hydrolase
MITEISNMISLFILTVLVFGLTQWLSNITPRGSFFHVLFHPMMMSAFLIYIFLVIMKVDYQSYRFANKPFYFFLDTTIIALAIPLYGLLNYFQEIFKPLILTLIFCAFFSRLSCLGLAFALGIEVDVLASLAPKSVTTPIALRIAEAIGGDPDMTTGIVVATGIIGIIFGPLIFKILNIQDDRIRGYILGISAHAIGTAKAFKISQKCGSFAILGLGTTGILTAITLPYFIMIAFK